MRSRIGAIGALAACLMVGGRASAQAPSMRLDYEAPAGCPDSEAFTAEVRARAPRSSTDVGRSASVKITANDSPPGKSAFEGSVVITDDSGVTPSRVVRGDSCAEVVRALALAVAMTFDPAESAPPVAVIVVSPPSPATPERPPEAPPPPPPERVSISAGLKGGAESGVGPLLAPALGVYGQVAAGSLSLRLGAARAVSPLVERGAGAARFARTTATLDGCPLRWRATTALSAVPCVAFEIGSLRGEEADRRVASLCPIHVTETTPGDPLFGYRSAMSALGDRMAQSLLPAD